MTLAPGPCSPALLAFDTATDWMSLALSARGRVWTHEAEGGAKASVALIPAVLALLAEAHVTLAELDAIAFGRGPGAFTGLRTACSVAQGLALGADKPVLPIDTLLTVAEHARAGAPEAHIWVLMDARMNEIYAAHHRFADGRWQTLAAPMLTNAAALNALWAEPGAAPQWVAGSAIAAFGEALHLGAAQRSPQAAPRAAAMLPLAEAAWAAGAAVDAALALPLYVRDKVAQTTAEREAVRAVAAAAAVPIGAAP
jgi:tRNA threonylcarbamoyladenosine biosynthesis protein TsaB